MDPMSRESLFVREGSSLQRLVTAFVQYYNLVGSLCTGFKVHRIPEHMSALPTPVIMEKLFCLLDGDVRIYRVIDRVFRTARVP